MINNTDASLNFNTNFFMIDEHNTLLHRHFNEYFDFVKNEFNKDLIVDKNLLKKLSLNMKKCMKEINFNDSSGEIICYPRHKNEDPNFNIGLKFNAATYKDFFELTRKILLSEIKKEDGWDEFKVIFITQATKAIHRYYKELMNYSLSNTEDDFKNFFYKSRVSQISITMVHKISFNLIEQAISYSTNQNTVPGVGFGLGFHNVKHLKFPAEIYQDELFIKKIISSKYLTVTAKSQLLNHNILPVIDEDFLDKCSKEIYLMIINSDSFYNNIKQNNVDILKKLTKYDQNLIIKKNKGLINFSDSSLQKDYFDMSKSSIILYKKDYENINNNLELANFVRSINIILLEKKILVDDIKHFREVLIQYEPLMNNQIDLILKVNEILKDDINLLNFNTDTLMIEN